MHDETAVCKNVATPPLCSYLAKLAAQLPHTTIICGIIFAATFYDAPSTTISEQKSSLTSEWDITFSVEK